MNYCKQKKPIKVLVMSVGECAKNYTVRYLKNIGGLEHAVVCLPKQYEHNAESYQRQGVEVFVYDEQKYINKDFEFFGFKPRNCGGVGRQGIAEAVEKYGDDYLCFEIDDDYSGFLCTNVKERKQRRIKTWASFERMVYLFADFYDKTGCELAARTGATIADGRKIFSNHKIFNNFIMQKGNPMNYFGFSALCSDDQRYNIYRNLLQLTPMLSTPHFSVQFHQNQGDRKDGNAVLYNSDCSWKKSFALKMMMPWAVSTYIKKEENRVLFREHIECSKIFPPIFLDENGKITAKV